MLQASAEEIDEGRALDGPGTARRSRRRWFRVRVATEDGSYLGSLRLEPGRSALRELIDDERTYLSLWNACREDSDGVEEFLAIHKVAIRYVVVVGEEPRSPREES